MRLKKILIFFLPFLIFGCVQNEYVRLEKNPSSELPYDVSAGDTVKVITTESIAMEFEVTKVSNDALIGEGVEVRFQDIWVLEKLEIDQALTAATSLSTIYALWGVLAVVALAVAF
jgi:hypothetical protein